MPPVGQRWPYRVLLSGSGLSFLSKLVERIVAAQIRSHMDSHDLGNTFQSAYKVGHSTETALLYIKNEIHLSLSKGMPTALVLLDLSTAFDTIDHHPGISFQFYADDTQLYVHLTHKNVASALDKLSHCLEDVKRWLSTNKLKPNPDKTEFIVFGSKSQREKLNQSFPVNILGNLISPTDAVRNLGVWFDSDFSFSCHVRKVCKACFAHVRDLKRLRGHLTHEATLMAANALVGSRLDYCNSLFRGLSALDLRKLQCVQNSLARIVANTTKYSHITPVRKALHWLPIKYRTIFKTAMLVYKFLHSGNPKYFEPFLIPRHSAYNTRRSQSDGIFLEVPHFGSIFKSRKHFGLSFAYDAPMIWNDLPDEVRSANSLASSRSKLKSYLFGKAYPP